MKLSNLFLGLGLSMVVIACGDDSPGGGGSGGSPSSGGGGTASTGGNNQGGEGGEATGGGGAAAGGGGAGTGGDATGGSAQGGAAQGGNGDGGAGGGTCEVITEDASAIGDICVPNGPPCPEGYTCQEVDGFVTEYHCAILCTDTCECPTDTECLEMADKNNSWMECQGG
ncbi:MAG: hypothetical protein HOW73_33525 [Polyangiaceae bacterium]|nr:hypothetical protein [Polyangiaceae bacterium]